MTVRIGDDVLARATFVYGEAATEDGVLDTQELALIAPSRETRDRFINARELTGYQLDSATVDVVSRTLRPPLRALARGAQRGLTSMVSEALIHTGWTDMRDQTRIVSQALSSRAPVQRALVEMLPEIQGTDMFNDMLRQDDGLSGLIGVLNRNSATIGRFSNRYYADLYSGSDETMGLGNLVMEGATAGLTLQDVFDLLGFVNRGFPASTNYVDVANALHDVLQQSGPLNGTNEEYQHIVNQMRDRIAQHE